MVDGDVERRREAARARANAFYRRRKMGLALFVLELPTAEVADLLIENDLLDIADCEEHDCVQDGLKRFIAKKAKIL